MLAICQEGSCTTGTRCGHDWHSRQNTQLAQWAEDILIAGIMGKRLSWHTGQQDISSLLAQWARDLAGTMGRALIHSWHNGQET